MVMQNDNMRKGEFVVIVDGAVEHKKDSVISTEQEKLLQVLLKEVSIKTAVAMAVELTGLRKKIVYQAALMMSKDDDL